MRARNAIKASIERLADDFPISPGGYFGDPGKSSKVRTIASVDPYATAEKFWRASQGESEGCANREREWFAGRLS